MRSIRYIVILSAIFFLLSGCQQFEAQPRLVEAPGAKLAEPNVAAAEAEPNNFIFDEDGIMYVATDYTEPIFMLHPDGTQDILFKAILPTYSEGIVLGNQGTLYMLLGGELHDLLYVDMGTNSTTR